MTKASAVMTSEVSTAHFTVAFWKSPMSRSTMPTNSKVEATSGLIRCTGCPSTGSPFNTNFVRIEGPGGIDLRTELFSISGKLSTVALPTPLMPQRSTYSRHTENGNLRAQQDIFVMAPPPPACTLEQLQAIGFLEQADLPADGLWCEVELFAGAGDAARLGHGPEVMQLAIVEHRRSPRFVKTEVYAMKIRIFLNYWRL